MPVPLPPTFSAGVHTKTRSPQRNGVNIPSGQVANASSDDSLSAPLALPEEDADGNNDEDADILFLPTPAHKPHIPESNGDSSSTERAATDETLTDPFNNNNNSNSNTSAAPSPPIAYAYPALPAHSQLTQDNMARHQRELAWLYTPTPAAWVTEAGMGTRLIRSPPASVAYSMLTTVASVGTGVSGASSGAAGLDRLESLQSSMLAGIQVFGVGAWCEDAVLGVE
ncbi:hypothetical protein C8A03DRAFT_31858 [Achaetomium macrosporum]|uniref:Uncharacterized protein n=1 Tax=Achaetomium macrosporum TaxID=79813 RepID=A0AAN7H8H3_9PEZI|nr:hypothetical protein C8A03DRAFT_31858 [Achaetomium macrosporum]